MSGNQNVHKHPIMIHFLITTIYRFHVVISIFLLNPIIRRSKMKKTKCKSPITSFLKNTHQDKDLLDQTAKGIKRWEFKVRETKYTCGK